VIAFLTRLLQDPRVRALDVDSVDFSLAHRQVLLNKPLTQSLFHDFYRRCRELDERHLSGDGVRIEIGSGSGFMRESYADVLTSDVKPLPFVQLATRAERLPLRDRTVRALYGINTFHHLPSPRAFFSELVRVLHPGGGAVLIEPYYGMLARALFRRMHASETFDETAASWESPDAGAFSRANQALSYIVFVRDRSTFEREFPQLSLVADLPHTHLRYVASGGVNFRQLAPSFADGLLKSAERILAPLDRVLALQHTLVLRRI